MRLAILDRGHGFGTKALFAFIRAVSRQPVPDAVKLVMYRPDFYGAPMKRLVHEAMRGPSAWSVGDRELMAAFVSKVNEWEFCVKAHRAVAQRAYHDEAKVSATADAAVGARRDERSGPHDIHDALGASPCDPLGSQYSRIHNHAPRDLNQNHSGSI